MGFYTSFQLCDNFLSTSTPTRSTKGRISKKEAFSSGGERIRFPSSPQLLFISFTGLIYDL